MPASTTQLDLTPPALRANARLIIERYIAFGFFIILFALRLYFIFHQQIDSDEPQHLHVAWGWAHGLVQYRDLFDNHTPLFHLLSAPLVALLGERADILIYMRLAMLPIFVLTLWATYALTRSLFGSRAGIWAALFLGYFPPFFFTSVQYRTDDLWVALWVLALLAFLGGELTAKRCLLGGALLGFALCVSMKSSLMVISLLAALCLMPLVSPEFRSGFTSRKAMRLSAATLLGLLPIPIMVALLFYFLGAWDAMIYCVIKHNIVPGEKVHHHFWLGLIPVAGVLVFTAKRISHELPRNFIGQRAAYLFIVSGLYFAFVTTLWPVVQSQTKLSYLPPMVLTATALPCAFCQLMPRRTALLRFCRRKLLLPVGALIVGLEILRLCGPAPQTQPSPMETEEFLADVLCLTDPGDNVLDEKGESIFRRRPYYYVLERFTIHRIQMNLLPANIREKCIETRTCVAVNDRSRFPPDAREFIDRAYVNVGRLSVAGNVLPDEINAGKAVPFNVPIPAKYSLISASGKPGGLLDGSPYTGPRELAHGKHVFIPDYQVDRLAFVWARAIERGFSPFKAVS